jgi:L-lysine exporter family protein LysE/ArgO
VISPAALSAFIAGLAFGLSLIVAIGAQNVYVLRQGALREHVSTVVIICSLSDAVLIAAGVAGASAALAGRQWLLTTVRILGAAMLFAYGVLAARRALDPPALSRGGPRGRSSHAAVIAACLAFTWLNPAVYLDTVILLGSIANTRSGHQWWFGGGATLGSILWFVALGFGARLLGPAFKRPGAWRVLDGLVALIMAGTGLRVLFAV